MRFGQSIESHFPINVMIRRYNESSALNGELLKLIKELEKRFGSTHQNAARDPSVTTQGGYQTSGRNNFFERESQHIDFFMDQIVGPSIAAYFEKFFAIKDGKIRYQIYGWANILRAGDWQSPHIHPTEFNIISGVYYVSVPDRPPPEGCLEFINPHLISVSHGQQATRIYKPGEGDLLLFPCYYMHLAHPFKGHGERAVISFDVRVEAPESSSTFAY